MSPKSANSLAPGPNPERRCVAVPAQTATDLRRIHAQIGHVIAMIEAGHDVPDIVAQLAAASKALSGSGFTIIAAGLRQCIESPDDAVGRTPDLTVEQLERLLLSLA